MKDPLRLGVQHYLRHQNAIPKPTGEILIWLKNEDSTYPILPWFIIISSAKIAISWGQPRVLKQTHIRETLFRLAPNRYRRWISLTFNGAATFPRLLLQCCLPGFGIGSAGREESQ
jgi:hypothetical protein